MLIQGALYIVISLRTSDIQGREICKVYGEPYGTWCYIGTVE